MKVGLVGAGHIATAHLEAWRRAPGCEVHGVFDLHRPAAEERARQFGLAQVFDDLDEAIESCDVLDVCTPPHTHADGVRAVVAAGKHLAIEKPVVTRLEDWEEIQPRLAAGSSKIAVIHNLKYARSIRRAHAWVTEGRIGRLLRIDRQFLTDPAADRMLTAERHWSHGLPGGRWFETLPHALYLVHYFAGALELAHVEALRTPSAPSGAPADEVLIALKGASCLATVHYSANCKLNRRGLTLHGTEGSIAVDVLSDTATLTRRRDARWQRSGSGRLYDLASDLVQWVPDRAEYLFDRLRGTTPHARLIGAFALHLQDAGPAPTPLDEVDYVVRNSDRVGREIDRQLEETR